MDSPRGRIVLMRVGHEEGEEISPEMVTHFDRCLGCMACVTACPSGVQYDKLIERGAAADRALARRARGRSAPTARRSSRSSRTRRGCARWCPGAKLAPKLAPLMPTQRLQSMLSLAPPAPPRPRTGALPKVKTSKAPVKRGTVAFMQGCIQRVFFGDVNAATRARAVAPRAGRSTRPRSPRCCGALQMHAGVEDEALALAEATIAAYEGFDRIVTNVAGCGSVMKDYGHILDDRPARASSPPRSSTSTSCWRREEPQAVRKPIELRAAYHDACHLAHAQGVRAAAARAAARHPRAGAARARRVGAVLRLGRHLQPAPARGRRPSSARARRRTCARPAPTRSPRPTRAARCRSPGTSTSRSITR